MHRSLSAANPARSMVIAHISPSRRHLETHDARPSCCRASCQRPWQACRCMAPTAAPPCPCPAPLCLWTACSTLTRRRTRQTTAAGLLAPPRLQQQLTASRQPLSQTRLLRKQRRTSMHTYCRCTRRRRQPRPQVRAYSLGSAITTGPCCCVCIEPPSQYQAGQPPRLPGEKLCCLRTQHLLPFSYQLPHCAGPWGALPGSQPMAPPGSSNAPWPHQWPP
jgi:hypothetical protein